MNQGTAKTLVRRGPGLTIGPRGRGREWEEAEFGGVGWCGVIDGERSKVGRRTQQCTSSLHVYDSDSKESSTMKMETFERYG